MPRAIAWAKRSRPAALISSQARSLIDAQGSISNTLGATISAGGDLEVTAGGAALLCAVEEDGEVRAGDRLAKL